MTATRVLIIEVEERTRLQTTREAERAGFEVYSAADSEQGLRRLEEMATDVIVSDLKMPRLDGMELIRRVRERLNPPEIILVTDKTGIDAAIEAIYLGAYDFVVKPYQPAELRALIMRAADKHRLRVANRRMRAQLALQLKKAGHQLIGASTAFSQTIDLIERVAPTDAWVLLIGEPGTGKSLTARSIHKMSERAEAPFVEIDCAAVPEDELASDLFGHEPRAFKSKKLGLFEIADGGTIFFKNILKLPASLQTKLLQVVETRSFYRLRGTRRVSTDFRMIASTCGANHEIARAVACGEFRADLLYRINTVQIGLSPLRGRGDCIEPLVRHLLERICGPDGMEIEENALVALKTYEWPGNIRQLLNCLERAVLSASENIIRLCDLLPEVTAKPLSSAVAPKSTAIEAVIDEATADAGDSAPQETLPATSNIASVPLREVERRQILRALRLTGWHREKTAQILGISLSTLYRRLRDYSLEYHK